MTFKKFRKQYHQAKVWAHHHTMIVGLGLLLLAVNITAHIMPTGETYASTARCNTAHGLGYLPIPLSECEILSDLYISLNGSTSSMSPKWFIGNPANTTDVARICSSPTIFLPQWEGITCSGGYISQIRLPAKGLVGNLPASLGGLTNLNALVLRDNNISGTLPPERSGLVNLEIFNLSNNNIIGILPPERSTWTNIKQFWITFNNISGELPISWSGRTAIETFRVSNNNIGGILPGERSTWTNIQDFRGQINNIAGELPPSRSGWTQIEDFNVRLNNISGPLPTSWETWTNIKFFTVRRNKISGTLPTEYSNWTNIQDFNANRNLLEGTLPASWSNRSTITAVSLFDNGLVGTIPGDWNTSNRSLANTNEVKLYRNCLDISTPGVRNESPQNNCVDMSISKIGLTAGSVIPGDYILYELQYSNNSTIHTGKNTVIHDIPGTGLLIIDASTNYIPAKYGAKYGIPGDVCYDTLISNTSGQYADAFNTRAQNTYGTTFQNYLNTHHSINTSNRGNAWESRIRTLYSGGDSEMTFYELMIGSQLDTVANRGVQVDITLVDPNCGIGGVPSYAFVLGDLSPAATGSIFITGQVDINMDFAQTTILNSAAIMTNNTETDRTDNEMEVSYTIGDFVSLTIEKTANQSSALPGEEVSFTISYINYGPIDATNVVITDIPGTGFDIGSPTVYNIATVPVGGSGSITITGIVNISSFDIGQNTIQNTAQITANEDNSQEPETTATIDIQWIDLAITKSTVEDEVYPGDIITYTIHYENIGTLDATNVVITDIPGTGLDVDTTIYNIATVPVGGSGSITITGTVSLSVDPLQTTIQNTINITADQTDPFTGNNTSTSIVDLSVNPECFISATNSPIWLNDYQYFTEITITTSTGYEIIYFDYYGNGTTGMYRTGGGAPTSGIVETSFLYNRTETGSKTITVYESNGNNINTCEAEVFVGPKLRCANIAANDLDIPLEECEALVDLYITTNGPIQRYDKENRLTSPKVCGDSNSNIDPWFGISCEEFEGQKRVTKIELSENNLGGTELNGNNPDPNIINNTIPNSMGVFEKLTDLKLDKNRMSGQIPSTLSGLINIRIFDISGNRYGTINDPLWNSPTGFSGYLPSELYTWENIEYFDIAGNKIAGILPQEWHTWENIEYFDIAGNKIAGILPQEWHTWENIKYFNAPGNNTTNHTDSFSNQINGELPASRSSRGGSIEYFNVGINQLTGNLPGAWQTWGESIKNFNVGGNNISGILPNSWSTWTGIIYFDVMNNIFINGNLPIEWESWEEIETFHVANNQISGILPPEWESRHQTINRFNVSFNYLTGFIPSEWNIWDQGTIFDANNTCIYTTGYDAISYRYMSPFVNQPSPLHCINTNTTITSNTTQVYPGDDITFTIEYNNPYGPSDTENSIIGINLGTGIVITESSIPFSTGVIYGTFGIHGDVCYEALVANTTGPYADVLNQQAISDGLNHYGEYFGAGEDRGSVFIDLMNNGDFEVPDYYSANMRELYSQLPNTMSQYSFGGEIFQIPGCGIDVQYGYIFDLGTLNAGGTGSITVTGYVDISGYDYTQTTLNNIAYISSEYEYNTYILAYTELDSSDNMSQLSIQLLTIPCSDTSDCPLGLLCDTQEQICKSPTELLINKQADISNIQLEDQIVYTITYENIGSFTAYNNTIIDIPGTGLDIISTSIPATTITRSGQDALQFVIDELPAGSRGSIILTGQIDTNNLFTGQTQIENSYLILSDTVSGHTVFTTTTPLICSNGATDYPTCTTCEQGEKLCNNQCIDENETCTINQEVLCNDIGWTIQQDQNFAPMQVTGSFNTVAGFVVVGYDRGNNNTGTLPTSPLSNNYIQAGSYTTTIAIENIGNDEITILCTQDITVQCTQSEDCQDGRSCNPTTNTCEVQCENGAVGDDCNTCPVDTKFCDGQCIDEDEVCSTNRTAACINTDFALSTTGGMVPLTTTGTFVINTGFQVIGYNRRDGTSGSSVSSPFSHTYEEAGSFTGSIRIQNKDNPDDGSARCSIPVLVNCSTSSDCLDGLSCNPNNNICEPTCENGAFGPECNECAEDEYFCSTLDQCVIDEDECPECIQDEHCEDGLICNPVDAICILPAISCTLTANPSSGVRPVNSTFTAQLSSGAAIAYIEYGNQQTGTTMTYNYTQAGSYTATLHIVHEDIDTLTGSCSVTISSTNQGGGGNTSTADYCPDGDFSPSYYDGTCGTPQVHQAAPVGKACLYDDEQYILRGPFTDTIGHRGYPYTEIMRISCIHRGKGTKQGLRTYAPDDSITRAEVLKTLVKILGIEKEDFSVVSEDRAYTGMIVFADVPANHRFAHYADYAEKNKLTDGLIDIDQQGNKYLNPNKSITRYEAIKAIMIAYIKSAPPITAVTGTSVLGDIIDTNNPYYTYVRQAELLGFISGIPQTNGTYRFEGNKTLTRAEFAKIAGVPFTRQLFDMEQFVLGSNAYKMIVLSLNKVEGDKIIFVYNLFQQLNGLDDTKFINTFKVDKKVFLDVLKEYILAPLVEDRLINMNP